MPSEPFWVIQRVQLFKADSLHAITYKWKTLNTAFEKMSEYDKIMQAYEKGGVLQETILEIYHDQPEPHH